jgi:predicted Zn-dependent protease
VTNPSRNRIRGISLAVELAMGLAMGPMLGLQLAACGPKPQQQPKPAPDPVAASDKKLIERMEKMRTRAQNAPGGTTEASDFASSVTMLFTQGVAKRQPVEPAIVDEAVQCLDQAKKAKPDDADLLFRKGDLLLAAGKSEPGAGALHESISLRPNLRAFTPLAKFYASQKQSTELVALCKKTLPAMKSDESRYAVLDDCLKYSGSTAPEVGLGWAPPKEVSFYKARRRELEARLAAAKAKEDAKEEAKKDAKKEAKEEAKSDEEEPTKGDAKAERKETSKK